MMTTLGVTLPPIKLYAREKGFQCRDFFASKRLVCSTRGEKFSMIFFKALTAGIFSCEHIKKRKYLLNESSR